MCLLNQSGGRGRGLDGWKNICPYGDSKSNLQRKQRLQTQKGWNKEEHKEHFEHIWMCVCVCEELANTFWKEFRSIFFFFFNVSPRHSALWFQHHSNHDTHARPLPPWWTPIQSAMEKFIRLLKSFYIIRVKARGPNAPRQAILCHFAKLFYYYYTAMN